MTLGERIKFLRKSKKVTLRELSKKIGISISFLSDIENDRSNPSLERLRDIAGGLEVSLSYLLGEDGTTTNIGDPYMYVHQDNEYKDINSVKETTIYNISKDLPTKALKEIEDYIEYIRYKYKKDRK